MLEARYGKGNVQRGGGNSLATRERVHRNIQGNRAGNNQAQSASIGQMAWELQNGRLPETPRLVKLALLGQCPHRTILMHQLIALHKLS